jgi:hypothetical protein
LPDNDIKAAMEALPHQFRHVVYYAVEGLGSREIASIMNTPRGTVASRLRRGRQRLRTVLVVPAVPPFPPPGRRVSCIQRYGTEGRATVCDG